MQQSPCFKLFSPDETSKIFPSFQRFNNSIYSPHTLFYGLGLTSSGQNSYSKKNILSKMKYSTSNTKQIFNKPIFLSNKRHLLTESDEKKNNKKSNNENINKINMPLNTIIKNDESIIETQNDAKKTKASSKKYSTYIPGQFGDGSNNCNNNNYGYYNNYNYNYGCISNSSLNKFNKSTYIGSVKKNLLPSLSQELKSNSKNQNKNQKNIIEDNKKIDKNNSSAKKKKNITKTNIGKYNNSESIKKNNNTKTKSNINTSSKKTANDSTPYDYLCKTTETLDIEKMVDYILSSTKIYNRYNDNKDNYSNNNINNLINQNENSENNGFNIFNNNYYINSSNKSNKKNKKCNSSNNKSLNNDNQKNIYSICKCKKVECLKYSCSCLKSGNKCCGLCSCINCKNKDNNIFKIVD